MGALFVCCCCKFNYTKRTPIFSFLGQFYLYFQAIKNRTSLKYGVGCKTKEPIRIPKIDEDFYEEM